MLQDYEGRFMRINEGMSEAFEGLNKGIRNYESTANEAINSHLTTFTNSLLWCGYELNSSPSPARNRQCVGRRLGQHR